MASLLKVGAAVADPHSLRRGWSNFTRMTNWGSLMGPKPAKEVIVVPVPDRALPCL